LANVLLCTAITVTLARLFTGENFGKQLLKIADGRLFPGDARAASKRLNRFLNASSLNVVGRG
jgi:hypothetical protein